MLQPSCFRLRPKAASSPKASSNRSPKVANTLSLGASKLVPKRWWHGNLGAFRWTAERIWRLSWSLSSTFWPWNFLWFNALIQATKRPKKSDIVKTKNGLVQGKFLKLRSWGTISQGLILGLNIRISFWESKLTAGCFGATWCANQAYLSIRGSRDCWGVGIFYLKNALPVGSSFCSSTNWTVLAGFRQSSLLQCGIYTGVQRAEANTGPLRVPCVCWVHGRSMPQPGRMSGVSSIYMVSNSNLNQLVLSGLPAHWSSPTVGLVNPDLSKELPWLADVQASCCFFGSYLLSAFLMRVSEPPTTSSSVLVLWNSGTGFGHSPVGFSGCLHHVERHFNIYMYLY